MLKAMAQSLHCEVFTAQKTIFGFSLVFDNDSNTGFILRQGPQVGLQKSTAKAGDSLINFCN